MNSTFSVAVKNTIPQYCVLPQSGFLDLLNKDLISNAGEKYRKEIIYRRNSSRIENRAKLELQAKAEEISKELEALKAEHRNLSIIQKLDKAGCIKSELVAKDIPADLSSSDDLDKFIQNYKEENTFLFKTPKQNAGGTFKTSGRKNLTPSQQMDAYIRAALGRS